MIPKTVFLILLCSCLSAQGTDAEFLPMSFQVDGSLLEASSSYFDSTFSFTIPASCVSLPDSVLLQVRTSPDFHREGNLPKFFPRIVLINPDDPGFQIILSRVTATAMEYRDFIVKYDNDYQKYAPDAEIDRFSLNGILCWQARRVLPTEVRYRLILDFGKSGPIQIDLVYHVYADNPDMNTRAIRTIESFIGSIRKIKMEVE